MNLTGAAPYLMLGLKLSTVPICQAYKLADSLVRFRLLKSPSSLEAYRLRKAKACLLVYLILALAISGSRTVTGSVRSSVANSAGYKVSTSTTSASSSPGLGGPGV